MWQHINILYIYIYARIYLFIMIIYIYINVNHTLDILKTFQHLGLGNYTHVGFTV